MIAAFCDCARQDRYVAEHRSEGVLDARGIGGRVVDPGTAGDRAGLKWNDSGDKSSKNGSRSNPHARPRVSEGLPGHLALLGLLATLVMGMAAPATDEIVESDEIFKSRGKEFAMDVFAPRAPGKYPAVIVLHGHGGPGEDKRSWCHDMARRLARSGYVGGPPLFRP